MLEGLLKGLFCVNRHQRRVVLRGQLFERAAEPDGRLRGGVIAWELLPDLVARPDLLAAPQPPHVSLPN